MASCLFRNLARPVRSYLTYENEITDYDVDPRSGSSIRAGNSRPGRRRSRQRRTRAPLGTTFGQSFSGGAPEVGDGATESNARSVSSDGPRQNASGAQGISGRYASGDAQSRSVDPADSKQNARRTSPGNLRVLRNQSFGSLGVTACEVDCANRAISGVRTKRRSRDIEFWIENIFAMTATADAVVDDQR